MQCKGALSPTQGRSQLQEAPPLSGVPQKRFCCAVEISLRGGGGEMETGKPRSGSRSQMQKANGQPLAGTRLGAACLLPRPSERGRDGGRPPHSPHRVRAPHRVLMLIGPAAQNQQGRHTPQKPGRRHPRLHHPPPRKRRRRFRRSRHVIRVHTGTAAPYGGRYRPKATEVAKRREGEECLSAILELQSLLCGRAKHLHATLSSALTLGSSPTRAETQEGYTFPDSFTTLLP